MTEARVLAPIRRPGGEPGGSSNPKRAAHTRARSGPDLDDGYLGRHENGRRVEGR